MSIKRISLIGVPVDVIQPENLENEVLELLAKPGTKQIVFLSIWNLLKARHKGVYSECINNADLIIPISKSILKGAKFLKKDIPVRYNPFEAVIRILSILDSHYKTLYLFGSSKKTINKAEKNIKDTFRNLRVIGRYGGYYPKSVEDDIVEAIYKAQPSYYKDAFGIFSERVKRVKESTFNKGHEIFVEVLHNPFKIFLLLPYMWYIIVLVWYRLFRKN